MELAFLEKALTLYGPLALGWPVAMALAVRLFRREEATLQAYIQGSESNSSQAAAMESLERSMGSVQTAITDLRAEVRLWRAEK